MQFEILFLLLFSVATAVALLAKRLKLPYTVVLVLAGLLLGPTHTIEPPHLSRELITAYILPGLLFEAAFHLDFSDFWRNRWAIHTLAVPGVVASIVLTAGILAEVSGVVETLHGFSFVHGLVFGAVVAATDPIAVVGLFKSIGAPRRLRVLVEGESLLNDGTALVLFGLILGIAAGGRITPGLLLIDFVKVVGTGLLAGGVIGLGISRIIHEIDDPMIEITLTTIAAYGSFVVAEGFQGSGVIATVTAGMLCGNYAARTGMSPSTRIAAETFWEYVAFALNSLVFLLIGFEVNIQGLLLSWKPILAAYLAVTLGRAVVISAVSSVLRVTRERLPRGWSSVLIWAGLRGALSMVLVLSLQKENPFRDLLVTMTFGVVLLTILLQGLTMAPLLRRLGLVSLGQPHRAYELQRGRLLAIRAALAELGRMGRELVAPLGLLSDVRAEYEKRAEAAEAEIEGATREAGTQWNEEVRATRRRLLLVEKDAVIESLRKGQIGAEAYEELIADLDERLLRLEEAVEPDQEKGDSEPTKPEKMGG
jgi:CPA1 family monovalent cation:H+ antiporter